MLARALRLSHALEIAFYVVLAMSVCDVSLATAIPLALLSMLALRALIIAVTYGYSWVHRSPPAEHAQGGQAECPPHFSVSSHSPPPRLTIAEVIRMVLGEYLSFVVSFLILFPFERWWMGDDRLRPLPAPVGEGDDRQLPVLLIHGYGCSRGAWWWLRAHLEAAGWTVATISLEPIYTSIDNYVDPVARRIDAVLAATGAERLILVGHSMGGLVSRAYLQRYGDARVARLVTLGTPHQGSELARLGFGANGREMRPNSAWLQALASPPAAVGTVAIYSPHDNFVLPAERLELPGAQSQTINGVGHLAMLFSPRVIQALLAVLEQTQPRAIRAARAARAASEGEDRDA
ncbi:MAG: alpha/beta fold hydrolase [Candidatus Accumulibacter sp.]|jgi:triacylglycerol lipase|uniref:esterase/lipase family protein n=1 Tax=unclassified Candidatus Accumulibacter TaxID=2619054 RepID=UPI0012CDD35B|nr:MULTISPECIES: alpha/beta fold hydrolase [unclassified Candidatus Accumulibacter]MQM33957.1 lipase [Candidatus Accumulibacter phosphatis]MBL8367176.1 alpha/beta fold hydrolase [Accumulibacter sp.]MBN8515741.1 alpha/beta fold hydrolase [Accumulibacter sp.]MBO3703300.1 alpha/beta fold hydrolase [Accumulibacter sp.]HRI91624.1 alpha/beta fold hydrolase [Accumulibacter sp.]